MWRRFRRSRWIWFAAVLAFLLAGWPARSDARALWQTGGAIDVTSGGHAYASYLATPGGDGRHPAVVLVHSFNGLEQGYRDLVDRFAAEGFVVLAVGWQTYDRQPTDETVAQLLRDAVALLRARGDVDGDRIGLTGFCAGGRYTMLFLPTLPEFRAGVAWYGFPYSGGSTNQPTKPADVLAQLNAPMLVIHGTADQPSPIADIYRYAGALDAAGKYFELKVYQGQPHGFMLAGGQISTSAAAQDAYREMVAFFKRTL